MQESLSIISDVPSKTNASVRIGALNQTIGTIHTLLTEYRVHEAREQLCLELEKESQELDVILSDMNEYAIAVFDSLSLYCYILLQPLSLL